MEKIMKKTICSIVGHKPPVYAKKGWWSPGEEYMAVEQIGADGTNRYHAIVYAKCARCGIEFHIGRIHIPKIDKGGVSK